ncbi:Gfo/Idh/MocA family oxidoreductase [Prosthecobacter sp.]|uniref:Gfo/Idh/MocA family protein n=1 Tax=Prosthecobacter sp. TaxID=1965333 RepID=UPI001E0DA259|nr:Gfo/Idh/MocA family oxidoreductase [Prosthecobacter sp.]MCB1278264.1 Gfo/Idh/MocA family oxidoreductase [Prosthecobacter sp.]
MTNRRSFLKQSVSASTGVFYIAKTSWAQKSPGDTINMAVIGFGGRGGSHISGYKKLKDEGVRVAALCDVDSNTLSKGVGSFDKEKLKVTGYTDLRKLLENKDIDAVSIATPNHWHALATIWAVQAGKDVYVEKPVSHCVWEGRQMVKAARKYGKMVQTGTQSRSSRKGIGEAVKYVQEGNLGKILLSRGLCYKRRASIGKTEGEQPIPESIDYDLWCGPGPKGPLTRKNLKYDWHWTWAYGNGDLGNQGIHQMDIARWFLGEMELSPSVWSVGGRLGYEDDGETANTQIIFHGYEKAPMIFEVRGLPENKDSKNMDKFKGAGVGVVVECEGGYVVVPNYSGAIVYDKDGKEIKKFEGAEDHFKNFINACRSRRVDDLNADILEGHLSSALCHTGNISHRLGQKEKPEEIMEKIKGDTFAADTFERMKEHLAKNEVDLNKDMLTLGPVLKMDGKAERFTGNDDANAMLKDKYREPFVVPDVV